MQKLLARFVSIGYILVAIGNVKVLTLKLTWCRTQLGSVLSIALRFSLMLRSQFFEQRPKNLNPWGKIFKDHLTLLGSPLLE